MWHFKIGYFHDASKSTDSTLMLMVAQTLVNNEVLSFIIDF